MALEYYRIADRGETVIRALTPDPDNHAVSYVGDSAVSFHRLTDFIEKFVRDDQKQFTMEVYQITPEFIDLLIDSARQLEDVKKALSSKRAVYKPTQSAQELKIEFGGDPEEWKARVERGKIAREQADKFWQNISDSPWVILNSRDIGSAEPELATRREADSDSVDSHLRWLLLDEPQAEERPHFVKNNLCARVKIPECFTRPFIQRDESGATALITPTPSEHGCAEMPKYSTRSGLVAVDRDKAIRLLNENKARLQMFDEIWG